MNKFINILWFLGDLFKGVAWGAKSVGPSYKEMKRANQFDRLMDSLENEVKITNVKPENHEKE